MSIHGNHPFHIVNKRPWPLTGAIGAIVTLIGLIKWFHQYDDTLLGIGAIITVLTIIQWWLAETDAGKKLRVTKPAVPQASLESTNMQGKATSITSTSKHHLNQHEINLIQMDSYTLGASFCRNSFKMGGVCIFVNKNLNFINTDVQKFSHERDRTKRLL